MWTEKEISRCAKTYINPDANLEQYLDEKDILSIKAQGTTYYNLGDRVFRPKVVLQWYRIFNRHRNYQGTVRLDSLNCLQTKFMLVNG